jgi:hypothetical protein
MQGTYLSVQPETGTGLIIYVRPTSDSETEEAKGDSAGAMAPPPVPPAKKVRVQFGLSLLGVNTYLFMCSSCCVSVIDVKTQRSP